MLNGLCKYNPEDYYKYLATFLKIIDAHPGYFKRLDVIYTRLIENVTLARFIAKLPKLGLQNAKEILTTLCVDEPPVLKVIYEYEGRGFGLQFAVRDVDDEGPVYLSDIPELGYSDHEDLIAIQDAIYISPGKRVKQTARLDLLLSVPVDN
jgi:hypothetical protein